MFLPDQAASLTGERAASLVAGFTGRQSVARAASSLQRILPERDWLTSKSKVAALGSRYCGCVVDLCFGKLAVTMNESTHSTQGHDSESGAPWAARLRHDHSVAQPPQRRVLRTQQYDSGDGNLLWRRGANYRRDHGMAERQHVRHNCISFLRLVLVLARGVDCSAEVRMGHAFQRHWRWRLIFSCGVCSPQ